MADKRNVLDRKTLDKYRKEIEEDFRNNYEDDLVKELSQKVSKDVTAKFNKEYKDEIINEVTVEVKDEVKNQIIKEEKKIGRWKSFKIFRLSIYILMLIGIICYVSYRLYDTNNLELIQWDYTPPVKDNKPSSNTNTPEPTTDVVKDFVYYKERYGSLLENFMIYDETLYKGVIKASDMKMIQRLQIAYSKLSQEQINVEGSIYTIKSSDMKNAYIKTFGLDDYEPTSFNIMDVNFVYSPNKNEYIAIVNNPINESIKYDLFDITEEDNYIVFKTYVYKVIDNKVFNIQANKEIGDYSNISNIKNKLNIVTFRFTKDSYFYSITNE